MSSLITVSNQGPLITATNFWSSPLNEKGLLFCSVNAGTIRVLLPHSRVADLADMRAARYCILSRGPWPAQGKAEGIEIMWEDHTDSPYALHLTPDSFDILPAAPEPGREWTLSAWTSKGGQPLKATECPCHWRRVPQIPYLRPWEPA